MKKIKDEAENKSNRKIQQEEQLKNDQERSDPPLTEIKGVTDPEEYVEPPVEDEPSEED